MLVVVLIAVVAWTCYALREWSAENPTVPARPIKRGQLDLVVLPTVPDDEPDDSDPYYGEPTDDDDDDSADDEDTDPDRAERSADPEWSGFPWYDSATCWGCDKACKASRFHPYQGSNIGAEIRGACASRSRARAEEPYAVDAPHGNHAQVGREPSTSVSSLWSATCEACGRLVRRVAAGLEPSAIPMARVADAELPF